MSPISPPFRLGPQLTQANCRSSANIVVSTKEITLLKGTPKTFNTEVC